MVFGTFDILHEGHRNLFLQAKQHGDYLIAVVATDKNTREIKGRPPSQSEKERLEAVQSEFNVDLGVLGDEADPYKVILTNKPDVICLGYDQKSCFEEKLSQKLAEFSLKIPIIRLNPYQPEKYKSSLLRKDSEKTPRRASF